MNWEDLSLLLTRPIAYHRIFATIGGGACAGLFLSQAFYWSSRTSNSEGWFYKTQSEWEEETGLTRYEQETVRKQLVNRGLLETKKQGIPCILHYKVVPDVFLQAIQETKEAKSLTESQFGENHQTSLQTLKPSDSKNVENHQTRSGKTTKLEAVKPPNYLYTEITPEITSENTHTERVRKQKMEPEPEPMPKHSPSLQTQTGELNKPTDSGKGKSSAAPLQKATNQSLTPRMNNKKGVPCSSSSDPWMVSQYEPDANLTQWLMTKRVIEQRDLPESRRTYVPSEVNIKQEIRNDAVRAADLWKNFLQECTHQIESLNRSIETGLTVVSYSDYEKAQQTILPYSAVPLLPFGAKSDGVTVPAPAKSAPLPSGAKNPEAYQIFDASELPEPTVAIPENFIESLIEKVNMHKKTRTRDLTGSLDQYRHWLRSGDPILQQEAHKKLRSRSDLVLIYNDEGLIVDFRSCISPQDS